MVMATSVITGEAFPRLLHGLRPLDIVLVDGPQRLFATHVLLVFSYWSQFWRMASRWLMVWMSVNTSFRPKLSIS